MFNSNTGIYNNYLVNSILTATNLNIVTLDIFLEQLQRLKIYIRVDPTILRFNYRLMVIDPYDEWLCRNNTLTITNDNPLLILSYFHIE